MAHFLPKQIPIRYDLCTDTVTVYHREMDADGKVTGYRTTVHGKAFFDNQKNLSVSKTGTKDGNAFLLVIPGDRQTVFPGDKVIRGVGPQVTTREQWADMIPEKVADLAVIKTVNVKYFAGKICHTEAGG